MKIKWLWNGIKADGKLHRVWYSKGVLIKDTQESITIYARDYTRLPDVGVEIKNETDLMTDYFEKDRMVIRQDSPLWAVVLEAHNAAEEHARKKMEKRYATGKAVRS